MADHSRRSRRQRGLAVGLAAAAALAGAAAPLAADDAWLYVSRADSAFLEGAGGRYAPSLECLQAALAALGVPLRRTQEVPAPPAATERPLLVLAHAYCLDGSAWERLQIFVSAGGALLVHGAVGVRDASGAWMGWERMLALVGAGGVRALGIQDTGFVTLGRAVAAGDASLQGRRLALDRVPDALALVGVEAPPAFWSTWGREPVGGAAAVLVQRASGRVLWLGFDPQALADDDGSRAAGRLWLGAALGAMRSRAPRAALEAWPHAAAAAVLLAMDTEDRFENATWFADELEACGLRGTFLCVSDLAAAHARLIERLSARHEVGSHTDDHRVLRGLPPALQQARLERSARLLARLGGKPVRGLRPPEEAYDGGSLQALAAAGFTYFVAGNDAQAMPEILHGGGAAPREVVRIPRLTRDDFQIEVRDRTPPESLATLLEHDLERVRRFGGVYVLSLHTQLLGRPEWMPHLRPFLHRLDGEPLWIPTAGELADWWRRRSQCHIVADGDARTWTLRVRNAGDARVEGLVARIDLPGERRGLRLELPAQAAVLPLEAPTAVLEPEGSGTILLPLPPLEPAAELVLRIGS